MLEDLLAGGFFFYFVGSDEDQSDGVVTPANYDTHNVMRKSY